MKVYIKRELVASKETLAKFGKNKKSENFRRREFFLRQEKMVEKRKFGGKEGGDHGIEWKFY